MALVHKLNTLLLAFRRRFRHPHCSNTNAFGDNISLLPSQRTKRRIHDISASTSDTAKIEDILTYEYSTSVNPSA
jgi:hypothetical protein